MIAVHRTHPLAVSRREFARRIIPALTGLAAVCLAPASRAEVVLPLGARTAVCFPPVAPVFGDEIPDGSGSSPARAFVWSPPELLADYVNECFYPPLSTRLMARTLGAKLEARLQAYREQRRVLLWALADQLVTLQGADEATREAELRAFAAHQDAPIAALEREAEALRRALIDGGLLQASVDWNDARKWRLGTTRSENDPAETEAQFQVVRAAAYYEDGFSIEQRGLLLELTLELQRLARAARPVPPPQADDAAAIFFSPAPSRFRLPKNAPPRLVALLGRFNGLKAELKRELRDAVFAHDRVSSRERTAAFTALAGRQEPRLMELDTLADEIRAAAAQVPALPLRAGPQLPADLARQLELYRDERRDFIEAGEQAVRAALDRHRAQRSVTPANERERAEQARLLAEDRITVRARVAEAFREEHRVRYEALRRRDREIHEQLKVVALGKTDPQSGLPLSAETLLQSHLDAEARFTAFGREEVIYRGYRHAMWLRGLSPGQRRLLFGSAWVGLAQPLPAGEPMPTGPQPVPRS